MKPKLSNSLIGVWNVAGAEALQLKSSIIEPMHLLISLCKIVDLDLLELVDKNSLNRDEVLEELLREVRRLRTIFRTAGVDTKTLRRRLREILMENRVSKAESSLLHRSPAAKDVFAAAEQLGQLGNGTAYPVHLLYASLLAKDTDRDELFEELKIQKKRLIQLAKNEVLLGVEKVALIKSDSRKRWN